MARMNETKQVSLVKRHCLIGAYMTLLAAPFAFPQTVVTESTGHDLRCESTVQQPSTNVTSAADTDAQIIQELERMRERIQQLEFELKQRNAGSSATGV